jgi:hypothetical protein
VFYRRLQYFIVSGRTTVGNVWLFVVFPFEFAYFVDVLPDFLRFQVQWISNDIARVLMVLGIIVHLVGAVYSAILRVFVHKAREINDCMHSLELNENSGKVSIP